MSRGVHFSTGGNGAGINALYVPWETFMPGMTLRWLIGFTGANSSLSLLALYTINENSAPAYLRA